MAIRSDIAVFLSEVTGPAQFITGAPAAPHPRRVIRHRAGRGTMATSGHGRGGQVRGYVTHGPAAGETRGPAVGTAHNPSVGARTAALVSLLTLGAAVGLLLVGVVLHIAAVLLTLVGLLACVTAGWYAVSRRGAVRTTALMAMVVAVAVLGAGLMLENFSLPRVLLLVAAAAVSVLSACYALRETIRERRAVRERLAQAARPRRPVLIMNLKSGGGKAERFRLAEECERRGIEPIVLRPGDDLLRLADDAVTRGADVIGMAGGDGSQALVATVASRRGVPHGCVPAGG